MTKENKTKVNYKVLSKRLITSAAVLSIMLPSIPAAYANPDEEGEGSTRVYHTSNKAGTLVAPQDLKIEHLNIDLSQKKITVSRIDTEPQEIKPWNRPLDFPWHLSPEPEKIKAFINSQSFRVSRLDNGEYQLAMHTIGKGGGLVEDVLEWALEYAKENSIYWTAEYVTELLQSSIIARGAAIHAGEIGTLLEKKNAIRILEGVARASRKAVPIVGIVDDILDNPVSAGDPRFENPYENFQRGQTYYERGNATSCDEARENYRQAKYSFEIGHEQGNMQSTYKLGVLYKHGLGVAQDHAKAFPYILKAAKAGLIWAQDAAASMCRYGQGTSKNLQEALSWYRKVLDNAENDSKAKEIALKHINAINAEIEKSKPKPAQPTKEQKWALKNKKGPLNTKYARQAYIQAHPSKMTLQETLNMGIIKMGNLKFSGKL